MHLYNVSDYEKLLKEDLDTITDTRDKFRGYRETVQARVREALKKVRCRIILIALYRMTR